MKDTTPTPKQIEGYCQKLKLELEQDPRWKLQQELGEMLMKRIEDFTDEERRRYDELTELLNDFFWNV